MNLRANYIGCHRTQRCLRRLVIDVVPTLLLLLFMAFAMSLVSRYAENTHFQPVISDGLAFDKISG